MNTMPDFFSGIINLSGEIFTENFDEFIALYYMIGRDSKSQVSYESSSEKITLKIIGESEEDNIRIFGNGNQVRIMSNGNIDTFATFSKIDGSIITALK
jgi:hypothetical protein